MKPCDIVTRLYCSLVLLLVVVTFMVVMRYNICDIIYYTFCCRILYYQIVNSIKNYKQFWFLLLFKQVRFIDFFANCSHVSMDAIKMAFLPVAMTSVGCPVTSSFNSRTVWHRITTINTDIHTELVYSITGYDVISYFRSAAITKQQPKKIQSATALG